MKFLIVCSSSGGHVYPGYNFGNYLKKCGESVHYLGISNEIEERIIPSNELTTFTVPKSFKKSLKNPFLTFKALKKINNFIADFDVIVGFGGFITFLVSLCPKIKEKMFYLHEANIDIGDSNKYSLKRAKGIFTSYKDTKIKTKKKVYYVGNPVVDSLKIKSQEKKYISFIFGSLGSRTLLEKTSDYLINQNDKNLYLLVTGKKYFSEYQKKLSQKSNIKVIDYIDRNELYSQTKLIFCRGGASTLSEVLTSQTNCVCIPSPYVKHNHQYNNAYFLFTHHALTLIEEKDLTNDKILECLDYYQTKYGKMELKNQQSFVMSNVSLKMYLQIKNDYQSK